MHELLAIFHENEVFVLYSGLSISIEIYKTITARMCFTLILSSLITRISISAVLYKQHFMRVFQISGIIWIDRSTEIIIDMGLLYYYFDNNLISRTNLFGLIYLEIVSHNPDNPQIYGKDQRHSLKKKTSHKQGRQPTQRKMVPIYVTSCLSRCWLLLKDDFHFRVQMASVAWRQFIFGNDMSYHVLHVTYRSDLYGFITWSD